ncbi:MAG: glucokinase [Stutzerimonas stutzeri]
MSGDHFRFTNNHWQLSRQAFCRELGLKDLLLINDFTAMALGMTRLRDDERVTVREGEPEPGRPRLVIGPGTGLGVAALLPLVGGRLARVAGRGRARLSADRQRARGGDLDASCTAHRAT